MATDTAPIELPAGRRSYISPARDSPDVNDPNWIPVLRDVDLQKLSQYIEKEVTPQAPTANYSPFPPRPSSPPKLQQKTFQQHNYSKSSLAPESVPSELEAEPLPPRTSSRKNTATTPVAADPSSQHLRQTSAEAPSSDGQETVTSDSAAEASTAPSTVGTASLLEEQYYTLPDAPVAKEDILPPQILSGRSSIASVRAKAGAMPPTSKYNRKPISSVSGAPRPATIKSQPTTPHESPRMAPALPVSSTSLPLLDTLPSPQLPYGGEPPPSESRPTTPRLQASKSSASERRARALHSHPSHVSLQSQARSRANSASDEDASIRPKPPSVRHKPRKSTDSRVGTPRSTIYDAQTPTPAPTTPLPQLPPEARTRPTTRDGPKLIQPPPEAHIASHVPSSRTADHQRMASFMSTRSTVVFRRFDDVHVKLLLCLQDEIAGLEKELLNLDSGTPVTGDKNAHRMRIMRELRRVVAEYGKLLQVWIHCWIN